MRRDQMATVTPAAVDAGVAALHQAMGYQFEGDPRQGAVAAFLAILEFCLPELRRQIRLCDNRSPIEG